MSTKSLLTVCLLLTTVVVVGCGGNQRPKLPGEAASPFPGTITAAPPPALTPAEVADAAKAAASSPEEQKVRELAAQLKFKAQIAAGQKAVAQSDDYFTAQAREQIRKDAELTRKNQLAWARALTNAHVVGCQGVIPNPEVERDVNQTLYSIVTVNVTNYSGGTVIIRTGYHSVGVAVSNFCTDSSLSMKFSLGYPESNYVQSLNVVLTAIGKRPDGTAISSTTSFTLYNSCTNNNMYCSLQREDKSWEIH